MKELSDWIKPKGGRPGEATWRTSSWEVDLNCVPQPNPKLHCGRDPRRPPGGASYYGSQAKPKPIQTDLRVGCARGAWQGGEDRN